MEKGSSSTKSPGTARSASSSARLIIGVVAFAIVAGTAFLQGSRVDPYIEHRSLAEQIFSPIETNPQMRLPNAGATITSIAVVPGSKTVRAVGMRGLAIVSTDGGATWNPDSMLMRASGTPPLVRPVITATPIDSSIGIDETELSHAPNAMHDHGFRIVRAQFDGKEQYDPKGNKVPQRTPSDDATTKSPTKQDVPESRPTPRVNTGAKGGGELNSINQQNTFSPEQFSLPDSIGLAPFDNAIDSASAASTPAAGDSVRSSVVVPDYTSVAHVGNDHLWVAGNSGVLLRTMNGGAEWSRIDFNVVDNEAANDITALTFSSTLVGCALESGGRILFTRDGGTSWFASARTDAVVRLNTLSHRGNRFVAAGETGAIVESVDGGATWTRLNASEQTRSVYGLQLRDDGADLAVGRDGMLLRRAANQWRAEQLTPGIALRSIAFVDSERGLIAGDSGVMLATDDAGASWTRISHRSRASLSVLAALDDDRVLALGAHNALFDVTVNGETWTRLMRPMSNRQSNAFYSVDDGASVRADGTLERTRDGGLSWRPAGVPPNVRLADVDVTEQGSGIAVGDGVALVSNDRGETWTAGVLPRPMLLTDVVVLDGRSAWAIGPGPSIVVSGDGGLTWREVSGSIAEAAEDGSVKRVPRPTGGLFALDLVNAWIIIGDTLMRTSDGGSTWRRSLAPSMRTGNVFFANTKVGWIACGSNVWRTGDGGANWTPYATPSNARIVALHFSDSSNGIAVGEFGTIITTSSGGRKWERRSSPTITNDKLISVSEADGNLIAVGMLGTVLTSGNDGSTWHQHEYSWLPAPWFYAALVAIVLLSLAFRRKPEAAPPKQTIADILANDRPLEAGEHDALDLGSRALHLSHFIRNKKTEPPMTFAVTGPWGSGKSSLMNLLKSDLTKHGHRPVWFNAWHHQGEQHLLAALFENVRRQAIPPIADINGVRFRTRLLLGRLRRFGPWLAPMFLLFAVAGGYLLARPDEPERVLGFIGGLVDKVTSFITAEKADDLPTAPDFGGTAAFSVFAGSALALLNLTFRGLIAFGIAPAVMLRKFSDGAKLKDLAEMTGFRYRFQREFEEVTSALRDTTMVIIIDDLDRCQPANVLEVLEAVNFLVSSGRVHVILGMDKQRVLDYVRKGYSGEDPDFAERYMQKLINVEVAIPPPTPEHARAIVDTDNLAKHVRILQQRQRIEKRLRGFRTALSFLLIASIGLPVYWLAHRPTATPLMAQSASVVAPVVANDAPELTGDITGADSITKQQQYDMERSRRESMELAALASMAPVASLSSGDEGSEPWLPFGIPIVLFAIVVVLSLADRPSSNLSDSREFVAALDNWLPVITAVDNTPRSLKRFVNHVRFLAMQGRVVEADPTLWEKIVDRFCRETIPRRTSTATVIRDAHVVAIEAARFIAPNAVITEEWFGPSGPGPIAASGDGTTDPLEKLFFEARQKHTEDWGPVEFDGRENQLSDQNNRSMRQSEAQ